MKRPFCVSESWSHSRWVQGFCGVAFQYAWPVPWFQVPLARSSVMMMPSWFMDVVLTSLTGIPAAWRALVRASGVVPSVWM